MLTIRMPQNKVLDGVKFGKETRQSIGLDTLDLSEDKVISVLMYRQTWAMNTSFFIGCFLDSIRVLGIYGFESKYRFAYEDNSLKSMVEAGIKNCEKIIEMGNK